MRTISVQPWHDRFTLPTADDLVAGLEGGAADLFAKARGTIASLEGVDEELSWRGIPWRWSFTYRYGGKKALPFAYLVPDPEEPKLGLPVPHDVLCALDHKKFSKPLREGLLHATRVDRIYWSSWPITSATALTDMLGLVGLVAEAVRDN